MHNDIEPVFPIFIIKLKGWIWRQIINLAYELQIFRLYICGKVRYLTIKNIDWSIFLEDQVLFIMKNVLI